MKLTPAQEEAMLAKFERMLVKNVARYCKRAAIPYSDYWNDLLQEARITFLVHLRKIEDESTLARFECDLLHALCLAKEAMHVVRIPHGQYKHRSDDFKRVPVDEMCLSGHTQGENGIVSEMMVAQFMGTLSKDERMIVEMRMAGYGGREILPHTALNSDQQMTRCLNKIRAKVTEFFSLTPKARRDESP